MRTLYSRTRPAKGYSPSLSVYQPKKHSGYFVRVSGRIYCCVDHAVTGALATGKLVGERQRHRHWHWHRISIGIGIGIAGAVGVWWR